MKILHIISQPAVLEQTIHDVQTGPEPDWDYACTKTFPYTREKIFSKIDRLYQKASNPEI
jgi:hypothetical protein